MTFFKHMKKNTLNKPTNYNDNDKQQLHLSLQENVEQIKKSIGSTGDIVFRHIRFGKERKLHACIIYTDGLVDKKSIQQNILEPLLLNIKGTELEESIELKAPLLILKESVLTTGDIEEISSFDKLYEHLLSGYAIFLLDNSEDGLVIGLNESKERGVNEPTTQTVVRGPKEGFSETLGTNIALVRRKIRDPRLRLEKMSVGSVTHTNIAILYMKGLADEKLIQEVHSRLERVNLEVVLESGMIEESIQDKKFTPFPTIFNTERPDVLAAGILEGRIALLVDGTPFALLVPAIFTQFLQSPEDYYQRSDIGTLIRFLRYIGLFLALFGPAFYIATTSFHQEMIPYPLLLSIAAQHEGVPLTTFTECIFMLLMFEILREAGIRMPRLVGQAVSIVGAVVIGQTAVAAGIVSAAVVIVISGTAISSFLLPANNMEIAIRILRVGFLLVAGLFGLVGMLIGFIALILHLCSLRSFGVPYMSPLAPFVLSGQKDTLFRLSLTPIRKEDEK